jgi:hypothetical protein
MSDHSHLIAADAQAEIFEAPEPPGPPAVENLGIWGCAYGHRAYFLGQLPYASSSDAGGLEHEVLAGAIVAYEESTIEGREGTEGKAEWRVVVRDLRNGHVLHRVPTGTPRPPVDKAAGVGNLVSLLVKSDGSAAWIVDDYGGTEGVGTLMVTPDFDVEDVDKSGVRLLASGTNVDPSSLAISVGGIDIGEGSTSQQGDKVYWVQGGQSFSAILH